MSTQPSPTPVYLDRQPDGRWLIRCPDCGWSNLFGRAQNAITRLSEHSLAKHSKRRIFPDAWKLVDL